MKPSALRQEFYYSTTQLFDRYNSQERYTDYHKFIVKHLENFILYIRDLCLVMQ